MTQAAEKSGAALNQNTEFSDMPQHSGLKLKSLKVINAVIEADKIINLPKIKTHMMAVYSGAVKNMFGIVPGRHKAEYHLRYDDIRVFSDVLTDICEYRRPQLSIMDAVVGMEGSGPTNGKPRRVGLILASASPYALDAAAIHVIGLKPGQVPTVDIAGKRGLGPASFAEIEFAGGSIDDFVINDYKKPENFKSVNFYGGFLPGFISRRIDGAVRPYPKFDKNKCSSCGICAKNCPPGIIKIKNGVPGFRVKDCIRCFCCHELCDFDAVKVHRPWFISLLLE
jgi:uncharacterized protein (DUF362 family)/Pyruvate/2-oxoacid:ferredoxin oxidoreductase delta subunit